MDEKLVCILNEMADFLSIAQMKKLQEVLLKNLSSEAPQREQTSNETYLNINSRHDDNPALFTTLDAPYILSILLLLLLLHFYKLLY